MSSLSRFDGWLLTDHRAGPGLPDAGMPDGKAVEMATVTCWHCRTVVVMNPWRKRERNYCRKCDRYICDACNLAMQSADYVHRSFDEIADMVRSGKWRIEGGSASAPVLVPTGLYLP